MTTTRLLARSTAAFVAACALASGCGSGHADGDHAEDDRSGGSPTTAASQFGSSMGVTSATAAEIGALGPGPQTGETWTVPVGLNVCGRFLDPIPAEPVEVAGVVLRAGEDGTVTLEGGAEVSGTPLVGDVVDAIGMELLTGTVAFPERTTPPEIDAGGTVLDVAGATFSDGDGCGGTAATVQVWVYPEEAVRSGDGIRVVTDDPHLVPLSQEGMAVVVAFSPESSLPTLPPSAMAR